MIENLLSTSTADLHVHSKYSDRPSQWFLRKIGAPESFVEPMALYDICKRRGMDFVTITDHNSIRGALEIAHLPGTFLSSEITTYFPEDGCKIHCLVFGINERSFEDIQHVRKNIHELRDYLNQQNILHAIAHPLFQVNDKLSIEHIEKLLLLFNRFEGVNGSRFSRACDMMKAVALGLTPERIADLVSKHHIEPVGPTPWVKTFTGGSDDHSGLYATLCHTFTPGATSVEEFMLHLRAGRHWPTGTGGTSLQLAHSLYHIAYQYYTDRFLSGKSKDSSLAGALLRKLAGAPITDETGFRARLRRPLNQLVMAFRRNNLAPSERLIVEELSGLAKNKPEEYTGELEGPAVEARRNFKTACRISHQLTFLFLKRFAEDLQKGRLIESFQSLSSLAPVMIGIAPYLTAFSSQHKDETLLRRVTAHFPAARAMGKRSGRKVWVTDTFNDVNGVARTIRHLMDELHKRNEPITLLTCLPEAPKTDFPVKNFEPVGMMSTPEYANQQLVFPPFLEVLEFIEENHFDEVIISTPGPLGLLARLAGHLLGLAVKGIYHTDFPRYIHHFTDDYLMEDLTQKYMTWFYGEMQTVYVSSNAYMTQLAGWGLSTDKRVYLPHGVDTALFDPSRRDTAFWRRFGAHEESFKFLYVGRVSKEKNLEPMLQGFLELLTAGEEAEMLIVGDGPDRAALQTEYNHPAIVFTGFLEGEELARAYASADVFVFPSMTDTFGNVVLEAQASGLPLIVSRSGGPAEIVARSNSGLLVDATRPGAFAQAMHQLMTEPPLRRRFADRALDATTLFGWDAAADIFLQPHSEETASQDSSRVVAHSPHGEDTCCSLPMPSDHSSAGLTIGV